MIVKLADIILVLLIKLVGIILALSKKVLISVIFALLLKKPYIGGRVDRCDLCSINRNESRCHLCTTIESY